MPGTKVVRDFGVGNFEQGDCQLVDVRSPEWTHSIRVDSASSDDTVVRATRNRRRNFEHNGCRIDGVQRLATEGSFLTLIGKVSYDLAADEFTLKDNIGIVGGGVSEAVELLSERSA